jgi:hypothetical protein
MKIKMSNKVYDVLKLIALVVLPGIGTLYFTLAGIWGLPYGEQVMGTFAAIEVCLGGFIEYINKQYKKANQE